MRNFRFIDSTWGASGKCENKPHLVRQNMSWLLFIFWTILLQAIEFFLFSSFCIVCIRKRRDGGSCNILPCWGTWGQSPAVIIIQVWEVPEHCSSPSPTQEISTSYNFYNWVLHMREWLMRMTFRLIVVLFRKNCRWRTLISRLQLEMTFFKEDTLLGFFTNYILKYRFLAKQFLPDSWGEIYLFWRKASISWWDTDAWLTLLLSIVDANIPLWIALFGKI